LARIDLNIDGRFPPAAFQSTLT